MTLEKDPIVFKCDPGIWEQMAYVGLTGIPSVSFSMRKYDMTDDRIYRLSWGIRANPTQMVPEDGRLKGKDDNSDWYPDVNIVSFENRISGEMLTFDYHGMRFVPWAPGWCFLMLGLLRDGPKRITELIDYD